MWTKCLSGNSKPFERFCWSKYMQVLEKSGPEILITFAFFTSFWFPWHVATTEKTCKERCTWDVVHPTVASSFTTVLAATFDQLQDWFWSRWMQTSSRREMVGPCIKRPTEFSWGIEAWEIHIIILPYHSHIVCAENMKVQLTQPWWKGLSFGDLFEKRNHLSSFAAVWDFYR